MDFVPSAPVSTKAADQSGRPATKSNIALLIALILTGRLSAHARKSTANWHRGVAGFAKFKTHSSAASHRPAVLDPLAPGAGKRSMAAYLIAQSSFPMAAIKRLDEIPLPPASTVSGFKSTVLAEPSRSS